MNKETSEKIVFLNFIMTCLMVCYHTVPLHESLALNSWDLRFSHGFVNMFGTMGNFAMCYFFFVSAYLLFRKYELKDYPTKIKKRITSLLIPYFIWQAIITILDIIQKQYVFNVSDILARTVLIEKFPQDGPLWYVLAIFYLAMLSPILLVIFKEKKVGWAFIVTITIGIQILFRLPFQFIKDFIQFGLMENVLYYLPCYLVGAYFGKFEKEFDSKKSIQYVISLIFITLLLEGVVSTIFVNIAKIMLPILVFYLLPAIKNFKMRNVYNLTFLMYAIHQPLIYDLWDVMSQFWINLHLPIAIYNLFARLIILVLTIALSTCIYHLLNRVCPKLLEILTGGRQAVIQRRELGN
jgi:membrane protein